MVLCVDGILEPPKQPIWLLGAKRETRHVSERIQHATNVHEPWAGYLRWSGILLHSRNMVFHLEDFAEYSR